MKVIDGGFGKQAEDADNWADEAKAMLEKSGVMENNLGFLMLYFTEEGELKIGGAGLDAAESVLALEAAKATMVSRAFRHG